MLRPLLVAGAYPALREGRRGFTPYGLQRSIRSMVRVRLAPLDSVTDAVSSCQLRPDVVSTDRVKSEIRAHVE